MEDLAPPLALIWHIKAALESGEGVRDALVGYCRRAEGEYSTDLVRWLHCRDQGLEFSASNWSVQRWMIAEVLNSGFRGQPIYEQVVALEREIEEACESELSEFLSELPFRLMVPLLLLQFPAFLLLLIGPLIGQITREMSR